MHVPIPDDIRHQLSVLAGRKAARTYGWPRDWRPTQVINPITELPFTEAGAWTLIQERLEAGDEVEQITLDSPPGTTGYVMRIGLSSDRPDVYVKLQLGAGVVIARSFHYSNA